MGGVVGRGKRKRKRQEEEDRLGELCSEQLLFLKLVSQS